MPVFLLDNQNFLFHLTTQANLTLYIHTINSITTKILVSNTSNHLLGIPWH